MSNTDTLFQAVENCIERFLYESKAIITDENLQTLRDNFYIGGMRYNEVQRYSVPVETVKGRKTGKYAHIVITRLDSGRYEPVAYIN